jgi:hypothetical protein
VAIHRGCGDIASGIYERPLTWARETKCVRKK